MKCSKEQFDMCKNNSLCHLCDGTRLFKKLPSLVRIEKEKEKKQLKKQQGYRRKKKEGMDFEKSVAKRINDSNNRGNISARRRPNSGAYWSMPGDIVTKESLLECKERGTTTSRGEKTITIHKEWLEKVRGESILAHKTWALPFRFKGSEETYIIKSFDDELAMQETINMLVEKLKEKENEDSNQGGPEERGSENL